MRQRADQLREQRDKVAEHLGLERSFIASRGALEAIAADPARATALLVPWQRELIGVEALPSGIKDPDYRVTTD